MKTKLLCLILILSVLGLWALEIPLRSEPQISVSITGFVRHPGHYKMSPTDRVSDLLDRSMQEIELALQQLPPTAVEEDLITKLNPIPLLREPQEPGPDYDKHLALRTVELKRGGASTVCDLLKFYRLGAIEENPILRDGDLVHVRTVEDFISASGCVGNPGDMEYREGDTLKDILALANQNLPGADLSAVRISRYMGSGKPYHHETVDFKINPTLLLLPGDRVLFPYDAEYRSKKAVTISGALKHHGEYLVDADATVWDVIQMAGGPSDNADLANAVMLNRGFNEDPDGEFERLKLRSMIDLTPLEYSYMRTFMRQTKGAYSIDFVKLIASEGQEANRVLNNLDYIYIPEKLNAVWVSGQVRKPGLVEYQQGQNWKYYIKQAGGYSNSNVYRGIRILRANGGNWVKVRSKQEVQPGDIVFVPDRIDRHFWIDVKDIVTVAASAITILIGVQNLSK